LKQHAGVIKEKELKEEKGQLTARQQGAQLARKKGKGNEVKKTPEF